MSNPEGAAGAGTAGEPGPPGLPAPARPGHPARDAETPASPAPATRAVELRHLRAFLAVAEEGNVTRAAAHLGLTQPAVSRTLAALERHLGIRLVDRSTHHLALTPEGVAFRDKAAAAVAAFDEALDTGRLRHWPLRLGHAWSAFGPYTTPLLRAWQERYPATPWSCSGSTTAPPGSPGARWTRRCCAGRWSRRGSSPRCCSPRPGWRP